jgi:hypothetical protein
MRPIPPPLTPERISKKYLRPVFLAVCLIGFSIHAYVAFSYPAYQKYDSASYVYIMQTMENGEFHLDELPYHRAPAYPAFLLVNKSAFGHYFLFGLRATQHFLGFLTGLLVFFIAYYLSDDLIFAAGATLAGFLSLDRLLFNNFIMTEPLYTIFLMSLLLLALRASRTMSNGLFIVSVALAGGMENIRPSGMILVLLLLALWTVRILQEELKKRRDIRMIERLKSAVPTLIRGKLILALSAGLLVYLLASAPVQLLTFLRAGPYYFSAKTAIPLWVRSVYFDKLSLPNEDGDFQNFRKDYEDWRSRLKPDSEQDSLNSAREPWQDKRFFRKFLNQKDGWRWHPMAIAALRAERNWSYDRSVAFLGGIASRVIRNHAQMYAMKMPRNIFRLLTTIPDWLPHGPLLDVYRSATSSAPYKTVYMLCLSLGMIGGLFLLRRIEYLFLVAVIFQHVGIHSFVTGELVRYRFPVSPILALICFAGLWSSAAFFLKPIPRSASKTN